MIPKLKELVRLRQSITFSSEQAVELLEVYEELERRERAAAVLVQRAEESARLAREKAQVLVLRMECVRQIARAAGRDGLDPIGVQEILGQVVAAERAVAEVTPATPARSGR